MCFALVLGLRNGGRRSERAYLSRRKTWLFVLEEYAVRLRGIVRLRFGGPDSEGTGKCGIARSRFRSSRACDIGYEYANVQ